MLFVFLCLISLSTIRPVISNIPDSISKLRPSSGTSAQSLGADCGRALLGHRIGSQRSASIPGLRGSCVGLLPLPRPSSFAPWISSPLLHSAVHHFFPLFPAPESPHPFAGSFPSVNTIHSSQPICRVSLAAWGTAPKHTDHLSPLPPVSLCTKALSDHWRRLNLHAV